MTFILQQQGPKYRKQTGCSSRSSQEKKVIYFELAHGVTITLLISCLEDKSLAVRCRAAEHNDKKLIEQTNDVKWSTVADTWYQFVLRQTCFPLSPFCASAERIHQFCIKSLKHLLKLLLFFSCLYEFTVGTLFTCACMALLTIQSSDHLPSWPIQPFFLL